MSNEAKNSASVAIDLDGEGVMSNENIKNFNQKVPLND
jgi:hypothetical protein